MDRVGFLPRLGAFLIDLGIFAVGVHLFMFVDIYVNIATPLNNFGIVSLLGGAFFLISYGLFEVIMAATPGKRIAGLAIGQDDGMPATRRSLFKRWAVKQIAVFFACPMAALWTILTPYNNLFRVPEFVIPGIIILAVIDTILTGVLLLIIVGGCFLVLGPLRQSLHDKLSGTAVFRAADLRATRAFSIDTHESATP
jgi:uncharacterized RDD family membrane protein YckC